MINPVSSLSNPGSPDCLIEVVEGTQVGSRCLKNFSNDELEELSTLPVDKARALFSSFLPKEVEENLSRLETYSLLNLVSDHQFQEIDLSSLTMNRLLRIFSRGYQNAIDSLSTLSEDHLEGLRWLIENEIRVPISIQEILPKKGLVLALVYTLDRATSNSFLTLVKHDERLKEKEENRIKALNFEKDSLTEAAIAEYLSNKKTVFLSENLFKKIFFINDREKAKNRLALLSVEGVEADIFRIEKFDLLKLLSPEQQEVINLDRLTVEQIIDLFPVKIIASLELLERFSLERRQTVAKIFLKNLLPKWTEKLEFGRRQSPCKGLGVEGSQLVHTSQYEGRCDKIQPGELSRWSKSQFFSSLRYKHSKKSEEQIKSLNSSKLNLLIVQDLSLLRGDDEGAALCQNFESNS